MVDEILAHLNKSPFESIAGSYFPRIIVPVILGTLMRHDKNPYSPTNINGCHTVIRVLNVASFSIAIESPPKRAPGV